MTAWLRVVWRCAVGIAIAMLTAAPPASAQQAGAGFAVRVTVTDSTGTSIERAEVLVRAGRRVVATARTSSTGSATIGFATGSATAEVVVRKLGYRPANRFLRFSLGDTVNLDMTLTVSAQTLGTVQVSARESLRRRSYFLDSETIANSTRRIRSALDAVVALRPFMLTSIGGRRVCGLVQEVWINGMRIPQNFPADPMMQNRVLPGVNPKQPVAPQVLSILASVRPEHILEMSYIDCFGGPVNAIGSRNAVFIVLKEGIEYRWPDGTFVVDDSTSQM